MQCTDQSDLLRQPNWNTQYGFLRIIVPFRYYVKSILVILNSQILPLWLFEQLWEVFRIENCSFYLLKSAKIDFTWFRMAGNLLNVKTVVYPQPKFPIMLPRSVMTFQTRWKHYIPWDFWGRTYRSNAGWSSRINPNVQDEHIDSVAE